MRRSRIATLIALSVVLVFTASAQNPLSPAAKVSALIGGKQLTIAYSAPSMRGRKIFGGLVPYGEVWRTGADSATTFESAAALDMGGLKLPKGTFTIFTLPKANEWLLIVNREIGQWGLDYNGKQDFGRVKMTVKALPAPVERFKIELVSTGPKTGLLKLTWEKTEASVPITVQ